METMLGKFVLFPGFERSPEIMREEGVTGANKATHSKFEEKFALYARRLREPLSV